MATHSSTLYPNFQAWSGSVKLLRNPLRENVLRACVGLPAISQLDNTSRESLRRLVSYSHRLQSPLSTVFALRLYHKNGAIPYGHHYPQANYTLLPCLPSRRILRFLIFLFDYTWK